MRIVKYVLMTIALVMSLTSLGMGQTIATLDSGSLSVLQAADRAMLFWNANTEADLAGYKVYQGNASGVYTLIATLALTDLADPTAPTYTTDVLAEGTYYWVVTAYDTTGLESGYSNEASKVIDMTPPAPPTGLDVREVVAEALEYLLALVRADLVANPVVP